MKKYLWLIVLCSLTISGFSQAKVLQLWQGKMPNSIVNQDYVEVTDSLDNWVKTRNVSNPTLTYYPASATLNTGAAVIICPGGAYGLLAVKHEGSEVAAWFNSIGVSAFVLKYRLPNDLIMTDRSIAPLQDVQEAIRLVRRNAQMWHISANKIGVMGFSAGGHLAATASTLYNEKVYEVSDTVSARPDFSLLIYPVISMDLTITHLGSRENLIGKNPSPAQVKRFSNELNVNAQTPPAFIVHSINDEAVPPMNSVNYAFALQKNHVISELHLYEKGGHGYGLGRSTDTESTWPAACVKWLKANRIIE
jgi:acetyl esterase/lipase